MSNVHNKISAGVVRRFGALRVACGVFFGGVGVVRIPGLVEVDAMAIGFLSMYEAYVTTFVVIVVKLFVDYMWSGVGLLPRVVAVVNGGDSGVFVAGAGSLEACTVVVVEIIMHVMLSGIFVSVRGCGRSGRLRYDYVLVPCVVWAFGLRGAVGWSTSLLVCGAPVWSSLVGVGRRCGDGAYAIVTYLLFVLAFVADGGVIWRILWYGNAIRFSLCTVLYVHRLVAVGRVFGGAKVTRVKFGAGSPAVSLYYDYRVGFPVGVVSQTEAAAVNDVVSVGVPRCSENQGFWYTALFVQLCTAEDLASLDAVMCMSDNLAPGVVEHRRMLAFEGDAVLKWWCIKYSQRSERGATVGGINARLQRLVSNVNMARYVRRLVFYSDLCKGRVASPSDHGCATMLEACVGLAVRAYPAGMNDVKLMYRVISALEGVANSG